MARADTQELAPPCALRGKVVLVVGGTTGIGASAANAFVANGAVVRSRLMTKNPSKLRANASTVRSTWSSQTPATHRRRNDWSRRWHRPKDASTRSITWPEGADAASATARFTS